VSIEFVEIGPARLEVLRIEPQRAGATLVFLHEGLGSLAAWRDFPRRVCEHLQLPGLMYSRRGYGASSRLDAPRGVDYLHREAWEVLPALLARLGVTQPLLVGHSDGGSIALLYAARHDPCAIAVMAPHVFVEEVSLDGLRAARAAWDAGKLHAGLARLHADPDGAFLGWNDGWLAPAFRAWNIESELPRVRCPVLAIQGHQDQYGTLAQLESIAAGVGGECELLMLDACGHAPQRDQPEAVIAALERLARAVADKLT
jgi:pimeloyl-ACP methyl ester carboxylesterase